MITSRHSIKMHQQNNNHSSDDRVNRNLNYNLGLRPSESQEKFVLENFNLPVDLV